MTEPAARRYAASVIAALGDGEKAPEPGDVLFEDFAAAIVGRCDVIVTCNLRDSFQGIPEKTLKASIPKTASARHNRFLRLQRYPL